MADNRALHHPAADPVDPESLAADDSASLDSPPWKGRVLVILAAVLWSTSGFFAKAPIFDDWPEASRGPLLAFWRALFASLILATMVRRVQWSWRMVPMVIAFAVMNWTYLSALVLCESTLAIWLQYTSPVWVLFLSWKLFREPPVRQDGWLLGFACLGMAVILSDKLSGASLSGIAFGIASGVCFACVVAMLRWNHEFDAAWIVFLNHIVTTLVFLPVVVQSGVYPEGNQWWYLMLFGVFQLGLPYLLMARALQSISSHEASGIALLEPVLVPVWVWVAWRHAPNYEFPQWTTLLGGGLILIGLLIRLRGRK